MAVRFLAYEVADLCLGKPPLRSLSISATVGDALSALKTSGDNSVSVWNCDHSSPPFLDDGKDSCLCVGKVSVVDVICFLCEDQNLSSPSSALKSPVSSLLSKVPRVVRHVNSSASLLDAIDLIIQGAQNLVVPIQRKTTKNSNRNLLCKSSITPTIHNGREYCWLTQEDVIRFLLSSIGLFSPIPSLSISKLGIIRKDLLAIEYYSPASSAIGAILSSVADQSSVAVVDGDGTLIGEISPLTLGCCDETVAAAILTLSAGDLMAYIDCGGPPEDLVKVVEARLKQRNLAGMCEEFSISSSSASNIPFNLNSSSSDEESASSPTTTLPRTGRHSRSSSYSARMVRRSEAIVCDPESSLVAVMIQAIAHRVSYIWVIEEDCSLAGIVTFSDILVVFREHLLSNA